MKKTKKLLTIAIVTMMTLTAVPFLRGTNGVVSADGNVAEINGTGYPTVQAAITAATSGQTVKMIANSTENVTVASDDVITLDLNGYELSKTDKKDNLTIITNEGELTIDDGSAGKTGTITAVNTLIDNSNTESVFCIYNSGKLTIKNGKFYSTAKGGNYVKSALDNAACVVNDSNTSECTIEDGEFVATATDNSDALTIDAREGKLMNIAGGTFKAISNKKQAQSITVESVTETNISGGRIIAYSTEDSTCAITIFCNNCAISGVELETNAGDYACAIYCASTGGANITSGTFKANGTNSANGIWNDGGNLSVLGGTFTVSDTDSSGIYQGGTMTVGGSLKMINNGKNLYLPTGKTVTIGTGDNAPISSGDKMMKIGVTTETDPTAGNPVAITGDNSADYSSYFTSDNTNYKVINTGENTAQIVKLRAHEHTWKYEVDSADTTGATLKATCTDTVGQCDSDANKSLTILKPAHEIYGDGNSAAATFKNSKSSIGGISSLPAIKYQKKTDGSYGAATETAPTDAGTYKASITIGTGADAKTASVEYTIAKKTLTLAGTTVAEKTYDGNTNATVNAGTLEGVVSGDNVSIDTATGAFADENVGVDKTVKVSYTLKGSSAGNYTVEDEEYQADITAKAVTVTAENKEMKLGEKVPAFTAKVEGLLGTDKATYSFNTVDPKNQGVYSIVPTGDAEQGNYIVSYVQGELVVSKTDGNAKADTKAISQVLKKYRAKEEYGGMQLDIELRTDGEVPQSDKDKLTQVVGATKKIVFTDTDLYLIIKGGEKTESKNIGDENDILIAVTYKFDFTKKTNIQVLRVHEKADKSTEVEELKETANANGEYVVYDKNAGTITVHAKKYSTYAFVYDEVKDSAKDKSSKTSGTGTGDHNNLMTYFVLFDLMLAGIAAVLFIRLRGQKK